MEKKNKYDLTEGGIIKKLFTVALPLIGMQVVQMTYNLTDMFWLGRLSGDAVAASGVVGMFVWLSMAFFLFGRMGAEIGVSQNLGAGNTIKARRFAENAITIGICLGTALALIYIIGKEQLIGFFGIKERHVVQDAENYLSIVCMGFPFVFLSAAISGIFNGAGNSRMSFLVNGTGLVINMILDPILIFAAGFGIRGAAIATVSAQVIVAGLAVTALLKSRNRPFKYIRILAWPKKNIVRQIFKWVMPVSIESFLFTFLSMIITTFTASYGSNAIAASRVSVQVESLTWLIGGGFGSALTAFAGQNYGAGKLDRIEKCFKLSTAMMLVYGLVVGVFLYLAAGPLISVFIPGEPVVIEIGVEYLRILACIQMPICLEGVAAGLFRGRGRTLPPSVASIVTNSLRVVLAYVLTYHTPLALTGIWIGIAAGAGFRGLWIYLWYMLDRHKDPNNDMTQRA